jgi:membrane associated rhomboid family serine protease
MIPLRGTLRGPSRPLVTVLLVAANTLVFLHEWTLLPRAFESFQWTWGLVPAREIASGSILFALTSALTSMFVHGGWLHLLGNMLYLWLFGSGLESRIGHTRFASLYFASGVVATQAQVWFSPLEKLPIVGASGAIAGVLGAYFIVSPRAKVTVLFPIWIIPLFFDVPAFVFIGLWFLNQAVSGTLSLAGGASKEIAWWAHVGGFLAGAALVHVLGVPPAPRGRRTDEPWVREAPVD